MLLSENHEFTFPVRDKCFFFFRSYLWYATHCDKSIRQMLQQCKSRIKATFVTMEANKKYNL